MKDIDFIHKWFNILVRLFRIKIKKIDLFPAGIKGILHIASALSIATIIIKLFNVPIGEFAKAVFEGYQTLLMPLKKFEEHILTPVLIFFKLQTKISVEWHHFFVINTVYIAAAISLEKRDRRKLSQTITWVYGTLLSLISAVTFGYFVEVKNNFIALMIPIIFFVVFEFIRAIDDYFHSSYLVPDERLKRFERVFTEYPLASSAIGFWLIAFVFLFNFSLNGQSIIFIYLSFLLITIIRNTLNSLGNLDANGQTAYTFKVIRKRRPMTLNFFIINQLLLTIFVILLASGTKLLE